MSAVSRTACILICSLLFIGFSTAASSAQVSFTSSKQAGQEAARARTRAEAHNRCMRETQVKATELLGKRAEMMKQLNALILERNEALDELNKGLYCSRCKRSASEIQRQEKIALGQHVQNVKGRIEPAPPEVFEAKRKQFNDAINAKVKSLNEMRASYQKLLDQYKLCEFNYFKERSAEQTALLWEQALAAMGPQPSHPLNSAFPDMPASTFGLGPKRISSEYNNMRAYYPGGKVETLPNAGPVQGLGTFNKLKPHEGIDYSSTGPDGKPLPFYAGFYGTAYRVKNSEWNTVKVVLNNGNTLEFLHASAVDIKATDVKHGQRVTPQTRLGTTGETGAGAVHLHVQVRNPQGKLVDPRTGVLAKQDTRFILAGWVRNRIDQEKAKRPGPLPLISGEYSLSDDIIYSPQRAVEAELGMPPPP